MLFFGSWYQLKNHKPPLNEWSKAQNCEQCQSAQPSGSYHCSQCNKCIYQFDHHNIWLNCCVGHYNRKFYIQCILFFTALMLNFFSFGCLILVEFI